MIGTIWSLCDIFMLCFFAWASYDGIEWDKEKVAVAIGMFLLGPLAMIAMFCVIIHEYYEGKYRKRAARIISKWEASAKAKSRNSTWNWYNDKVIQEERFNLLRESIRQVSDKDLDFLTRVGKDLYDIEQPLRDAIVDELIERRIINHE